MPSDKLPFSGLNPWPSSPSASHGLNKGEAILRDETYRPPAVQKATESKGDHSSEYVAVSSS